jgi:3-isopropylmalate/(R)-2-methylmalate dehydratase large subunit
VSAPRTLFERIWSSHVVYERDDGQTLLYVDRHLLHDGSAPAFQFLKERGVAVRAPERCFATPDHYVPTDTRDPASMRDAEKVAMSAALARNAGRAGILFFGLDDARQGIAHIVAPEQGITQPGLLIVCSDSHTSTHGAVGALAFGIGATEAAHVLATQTIWQRRPKTLRVTMNGRVAPGVYAKDLILALIARIGAGGAAGFAIEYAGDAIRSLSMEGRFTVCNMSIEAGARAGMVAPDDTTFEYLAGRPFAPKGAEWERMLGVWRALPTDRGAVFDREVALEVSSLEPMVTWGTSPEDAAPISARVPDPAAEPAARRESMHRSLEYMGLAPGIPLTEVAIDRVFIGSCTNSRIEDLRAAASVVDGRKVAPRVEAWVVPGSGLVKAQAEAEGLDRIFTAAGFQWRHPGCSMCLGTNGDIVAPGARCASTSNRNFMGRQGPGARTHLMSPAMAAAAAVTGRLTDVRRLAQGSQP